MEKPDKTFIVVRADLADEGLRAAQIGHAAIEFTARHGRLSDNIVVLAAATESALAELVARAAGEGARVERFLEEDLGGEMTAAGFGPEAGRLLSSLPLLGKRPRRAA